MHHEEKLDQTSKKDEEHDSSSKAAGEVYSKENAAILANLRDNGGGSTADLPDLVVYEDAAKIKDLWDKNKGRIDRDKDGLVSKDEIDAAVLKSQGSEKAFKGEDAKFLVTLQDNYDNLKTMTGDEKDRGIDNPDITEFHEQQAAYNDTTRRIGQDKPYLEENFSDLDSDHNKFVTREELMNALQASTNPAEQKILRDLLRDDMNSHFRNSSNDEVGNESSGISEADVTASRRSLDMPTWWADRAKAVNRGTNYLSNNFEKIDSSHDGVVSQEEIHNALAKAKDPKEKQALETLDDRRVYNQFRLSDVDGKTDDVGISREDVKKAWSEHEKIRPRTGEIVEGVDYTMDAAARKAEYQQQLNETERVLDFMKDQSKFHDIDLNADGKVSTKELTFYKSMTKNPEDKATIELMQKVLGKSLETGVSVNNVQSMVNKIKDDYVYKNLDI